MSQKRITDDLQALISVLPPKIAEAAVRVNNSDNLIEIVMDLGRRPVARFTDGEEELAEEEVSRAEIDYVVTRIGDFDADNRAGLERTLHRISAIRNRRGQHRRPHLPRRPRGLRHDRYHPGSDRIGQEPADPGPPGHRQDHHAARSRPHPGRDATA